MNVLQVIDKSFVGGGQQIVRNLVEGLRQAGVSTTVACRDGGPLVADVRELGADVQTIPFDKRFRPAPARAVAELARRFRADVIHAHGLVATSYCTAARSLFGVRTPLIYHQHGFHHHNYGATTIHLRKHVERAIARRADRVIAASQADRDQLVDEHYALAGRVRVIDYGIREPVATPSDVATARAATQLDDRAPVVGLIARLHPQKGIDTFLRAAQLVSSQVPGVCFVVVGDGELAAPMRELARSLRVDVRWAGTQPSARFLPVFSIGVISSRWEGMPLILLEYMASGLPIVATDLPACRHAVNDQTAALVAPDNPATMADAITTLLREPRRAREMADAARRAFVERFTIGSMIRAFQAIYDEVRQ